MNTLTEASSNVAATHPQSHVQTISDFRDWSSTPATDSGPVQGGEKIQGEPERNDFLEDCTAIEYDGQEWWLLRCPVCHRTRNTTNGNWFKGTEGIRKHYASNHTEWGEQPDWDAIEKKCKSEIIDKATVARWLREGVPSAVLAVFEGPDQPSAKRRKGTCASLWVVSRI